MTSKEVQELQVGDEVFWNDPDDGICSRNIEIASIDVFHGGIIVRITDINGDMLEAFGHELS